MESDNYISNSCLICEYVNGKLVEFIDVFIKNITVITHENAELSGRRLCQPHFRLIMNQLDSEIVE